MYKTNKIHTRKCCGCNIEENKENLIKITRSKNGEVRIMPDSKFTGRSVYICPNSECIEKAFKKGKLFKILKCKHDETLKEKIRAVLET